jgi:rhamnopyranosyl-N-acetylglucosaminyl-diphospho-decaprenol beta-1,3/1,4-galactofuranosyltransferase
MGRIIAVIVTMARPRELDRLLGAIGQQQLRPDATIVIENMPRRATAEVLDRHPAVRHIVSQRNLGGAGGFSYGILTALADGATHVWLMDDDGLPLEPGCLGSLAAVSETHDADVVSPVIIDMDDVSRLAFPYFVEGRWMTTRREMGYVPLVRHFAHLFNGALVRAEAFGRFGIPDYRLFVRGDETDFLHRVRRGGGLVLTVTDVAFLHPSGAPDTVPLLGGRLHAIVPADLSRQFYFFRNRGYLVRRHKLVAQALHDVIRYSLYFLAVRRGDWRGLGRWCRLIVAGFQEDFRPYQPPQSDSSVQLKPHSPQSETSPRPS